jgi:formate--tetrahydrofolate ligase
MTPTPLGEGKTLTAIGLSMAMNAIGAQTIATLRQPSLGPVFGIKGGASGSGLSQVVPSDQMNLHLTGDFHAVTAAHNLLAAIIDSQLAQDNPANLDPNRVAWPRVLDLNDRALRHVITGLGGPAHGRPRETRFDITATSEVMAVLSLARDINDLKRRLSAMTVGLSVDGKRVTADRIGGVGALAALLRDAIQPNLLQTNEHTPVLVHTGPFANISHGSCSVISDMVALKLASYTVTEAGFGADLGLEKLIHIKCPVLGVWPSVAVLVCTIRALKLHSGKFVGRGSRTLDPEMSAEDLEAIRAGAVNLRKHIENVHRFGLPVVVAVNRFAADTDRELELVLDLAREAGAEDARVSSAWSEGSTGAMDLARAVVAVAENPPRPVRPIAVPGRPIQDNIRAIATQIYGAANVKFTSTASRQLAALADEGLDTLPVCMAKTPLSFSDDPRKVGCPRDFDVTVHELRPYTGAGYVTALCGEILTMPGLPRDAAAYAIDVDADGVIRGIG